jgi:DNA-binding NarL/FixJ family response regulator
MQTTLLIVDDHPVVQIGMRAFIDRYKLFHFVEAARTGKEAVGFIKKHRQDPEHYKMAIVDINLPDYEAISLVKFILEYCPKLPIMMFSMEQPRLYVKRLISAGVKGFLNKNSTDDELLFAIKSIKAGKTYFSSDIMTDIITTYADDLSKVNRELSARETEILSLMIRGKSPKEISNLLHLHKSSVATYRSRVFNKIGVRSNFELYQWALKEGLIVP